MQVGFGGTSAALAATQNAQSAPPRRVADQETQRPVQKTDKAELRRHDEVDRAADDRRRASDDDHATRRADDRDQDRKVDIRV